jgi:prepilin-type processing-associated H-X9-DG protein
MKTLKANFGFWDITKYPIGGKFTRGETDLPLKDVEPMPWARGCNSKGQTLDGRTIAFFDGHLKN